MADKKVTKNTTTDKAKDRYVATGAGTSVRKMTPEEMKKFKKSK